MHPVPGPRQLARQRATTATPRAPPLRALAAAAAATALALLAASGTAHALRYDEVAASIGVDFHHAGDDGLGTFLSVLGSGACFADFDNDGFEDLFLVNLRFEDRALDALYTPHSQMFRNNGDGTFTDVTPSASAFYQEWGQGCAVGDYDDDGKLDLFIAGWGENQLLRNEGDFRFRNVTAISGVSSAGKCPDFECWGTSAMFADLDEDGCIDLYVVNYVDFDPDNSLGNSPSPYDGQKNLFYHNLCDGTFAEETDAWNLDDDPGERHSKALGVSAADYDRDGDLDIYVTSDGVPNTLFRNNGDRTFTDVGPDLEVDDPRAGMGQVFQDISGDGYPDLYMTHYAFENNGFYVNVPGAIWEDHSGEGDLDTDRDLVGWGTGFIDFDNDADLDIYVANGHTDDRLGNYALPRLFYRNDGGLVFKDVTLDVHTGPGSLSIGRGSAAADYDFDGDVDIVVANNGNSSADFLRASSVTGNFLLLDVRQPGANGFAIGSVVKVTPAGKSPTWQTIQAGSSYASQNAHTLHYGLSDSATADVEILYPDGVTETYSGLAANQLLRLVRGNPTPLDDTLSPSVAVVASTSERNGWYNEVVHITLAASDRGVSHKSGVSEVRFRVDGGAWQIYTGPIEFGAGVRTLEYHAFDHAGNRGSILAKAIRVDVHDPFTTATARDLVKGWFDERSRIVLEATDVGSGVVKTHYRVDDGPLLEYGDPFGLAGESPATIDYFSEDLSGNTEPIRTINVSVDTLPPVSKLNLTGPEKVVRGARTITSDTLFVFRSEDGASGVDRVELRIDGGDWRPVAYPDRIEGIADGPHELEWRSIDNIGHVEPAQSMGFTLDNHHAPPLFLLEPRNESLYFFTTWANLSPLRPAIGPLSEDGFGWKDRIVAVGNVRITAQTGDDVSGTAWIRYLIDGREMGRVTNSQTAVFFWDSWFETAGWHVLTLEAADGRGNVATLHRDVFVLPAAFPGVQKTLDEGPTRPPGGPL